MNFSLDKEKFEMLMEKVYFAIQNVLKHSGSLTKWSSYEKKHFLFSLLLSGIFINTILALPRFAVRLGDKCIDCHYNPTGGIIRNEDGWNFGKNIMSAITPRDQDFLTTPKIGDNITFGLDYRTQFLIRLIQAKLELISSR